MDKLLFPTVTPVFWWVKNALSTHRIIIEQGGTWSSKTYSIMQNLAIIAMTEKNKVITVVGEDLPNLKRGALRDFQDRIVAQNEVLKKSIVSYNGQGSPTYRFSTGTILEFASYQTAGDAASGKRDYLFVNEIPGVAEDICRELFIRTDKNIIIDYNAYRQFWVHEKLLQEPEAIRHISNFTHNPYLPVAVKRDILRYKANDVYRWRVLGLGLTGELKENLWLDTFSRERHIRQLAYNPMQPLCISIDFNVGKFVAIAYQCSDVDNSKHSFFHVIDEFVLSNANIIEMAQKIRNRYGNAMLYVTGDQSGARRDTGYTSSSDTLLSILQRELRISNKQMLFGSYNKRYEEKNPSFANSWALCNNVLSHHANFAISPTCKELINDCEIAVFDDKKKNFALKKGDGAGKWAMNALDCLRYALAANCPNFSKSINVNVG